MSIPYSKYIWTLIPIRNFANCISFSCQSWKWPIKLMSDMSNVFSKHIPNRSGDLLSCGSWHTREGKLRTFFAGAVLNCKGCSLASVLVEFLDNTPGWLCFLNGKYQDISLNVSRQSLEEHTAAASKVPLDLSGTTILIPLIPHPAALPFHHFKSVAPVILPPFLQGSQDGVHSSYPIFLLTTTL